MESFLNYIWQLFLIIACFTGIALCLALIVAFFKSMFKPKEMRINPMFDAICDEYIDLYNKKIAEGCSHEEANEYAFEEMNKKIEDKFK